MDINIFLTIISLLVAALQALTLFIINDMATDVRSLRNKVDQHLQDHAERKFCKPCEDLLRQAIPIP